MTQRFAQATRSTKTRWEPYPAYKDSGVEWLGEIPKHWEVKRLKHLCSQSAVYGANEPSGSYADEGVQFLRTTDINDDGRLSADGAVYLEESLIKEYLLKDGDLLLSRSGTIGRSFLYNSKSHGPCAYAGYLVKFSPNPDNVPSFLFYLTKASVFTDWLGASIIQSTIGNVNGQKYANMPIACPLPEEQRDIVGFLDRETAKIDALIANKEQLNELLEEKRTALISHAVTKGLNPNAPMKGSGIEWLGEIPAHWNVKRLKFLAYLLNGYAFDSESYVQDGVPIIRIGDVKDFIDWTDVKRVPRSYLQTLQRFLIIRGDILLALTGATIGKTAVFSSDEPALLNQRVGAIRARQVNQEFLSLLVKSDYFHQSIDLLCYGGAQENIGKDQIGNIVIPLPKGNEQMEIVSIVNSKMDKINTLVVKTRQHIEKLREYRTALISAAVTGKIDVRGISA